MPGATTGYLFGVFDLFHVAHLDSLRAAAGKCDSLVVGVATDELVEKLSGARPYVPFPERIEIVSAVRDVAAVRRLDTDDLAGELERAGAGQIFLPEAHLDVAQSLLETELAELRTPVVRLAAPRRTAAVAVLDALSRVNDTEVA